ncbi:unnamed protein product [Protopolystoma xenopodis]|uniref:Uncharacterized protein n=1 Tax=Protopolystoma xenopodis TaxID=117903 RepID=A0A448XJ27_9PLAT|nr:unnamed protein product [Protopolystoma xenopodis]
MRSSASTSSLLGYCFDRASAASVFGTGTFVSSGQPLAPGCLIRPIFTLGRGQQDASNGGCGGDSSSTSNASLGSLGSSSSPGERPASPSDYMNSPISCPGQQQKTPSKFTISLSPCEAGICPVGPLTTLSTTNNGPPASSLMLLVPPEAAEDRGSRSTLRPEETLAEEDVSAGDLVQAETASLASNFAAFRSETAAPTTFALSPNIEPNEKECFRYKEDNQIPLLPGQASSVDLASHRAWHI